MPVEIFLCYAHEDENELKGLEAHLGSLRHQGFLDVWYDRKVRAPEYSANHSATCEPILTEFGLFL